MKRFSNILIVHIIYFSLGILHACVTDYCSHGPYDYQTISIESWARQLTSIEERGDYGEQFYNTDVLNASDTLQYSKLGVVIRPIVDAVSGQWKTGNILNSSYACSPAFFYDNITGIEVLTENDYNQEYEANASINEIILVRETFRAIGLSVESFLNFGRGRESYEKFFFRLSQPPSDTLSLALNISITVDDERTYVTRVDSIVITP